MDLRANHRKRVGAGFRADDVKLAAEASYQHSGSSNCIETFNAKKELVLPCKLPVCHSVAFSAKLLLKVRVLKHMP